VKLTRVKSEADRAEARAVKAALLEGGLTYRDLAKMTGLAHGTIKIILCSAYRFLPAKRRINQALGREFFSGTDNTAANRGLRNVVTKEKE
jgi:hypothetical protein